MNCLICSDKFKGSISAQEACQAIHLGLQSAYPDYNYHILPMADGGDGTLSVIDNYIDATHFKATSVDPLNRPIDADYLMSDTTAYIELAKASGMSRISMSERSPLYTDTRGTGILIRDALQKGAQHIVLTLGGSCSTDAGLGIAASMGYKLLNKNGHEVPPQGAYLSEIDKIVTPDDLPSFSIEVLCDVINPLYGSNGAAHVFAPQKGANTEEVEILDKGLKHISQVVQRHTNKNIATIAGGGSAGGIAAGLYGLMDAKIKSGFDILSEMAGLSSAIKKADIVITGEGQLDHTSLSGKVVGKVAQLCKNTGTPIIAIVGNNELEMEEIDKSHLQDVHAITSTAKDVHDAMSNAKRHVTSIASRLDL